MQRLGYPFRTVVGIAAALMLAVLWLVMPVTTTLAWSLTAVVVLAALLAIGLRTHQQTRARQASEHVLTALGSATAEVPVRLRTRMPLVLVTGDALPSIFNHESGRARLVHVGEGAIWVRADRIQDLPRLALAMRQWRDGHAPDGVVLSVAPALHADADALSQSLRIVRQAVADASRMIGAPLPGYVAVYQRLVRNAQTDALAAVQWHGISSGSPLTDMKRFDAVIESSETDARRHATDPYAAASVAGLASIIGWTQRVIFDTLADSRQPAAPWALHGAGWIDCGPASNADKPWERDVQMQTRVIPAVVAGSPAPWPLPQPLIAAMSQRVRASPRHVALAHVGAMCALALAVAFWGAGRNNAALLTRIGGHMERYAGIAPEQDAGRRDALHALIADRDELDRYGRSGVPLRLSLGEYHGAPLMPSLNTAIAAYQPPEPPPAVVTLDSMSLFDSGKAMLKPGSNRALVDAVEMIKAHPDKRILVAGHTDNAGNPRSNLTLSMARAAALRDWLIDASGISATQFATQGYGDTRPIADNNTPEGRAKNRRVEITLVPETNK
ncbi:OmpA family protein [Caballeronia sp. GAWG1-1]|uniref:OmpA family protein n=1 Tax=Caballeronia sp. GAWG1-1 TaxID=2921742 RepID=UPI002027BDDD|nr:OmpA family protein [Caballeronia sp. GAWG1-1]